MRGKSHPPEVKAAVMSALLAGQGVMEVAESYQLDEATVRNWKRALPQAALTELNAKKEAAFDQLVADYLREILTTLSVQARHARDSAWLKGQSGSDFAVQHGVLADKAFRILSAAERDRGDDPPDVP